MKLARLARLVAVVATTALATSGCASSAAGISGDAGAGACGSCHTTEYAAWSTSRLASSGTSPAFTALAASAGAAWGEPAETRCKTCHQPGFGGDHGIGCVACHAATGNLADRDGLLTVDVGAPVDGPFVDPQPTSAHGSTASGFLESPQLCGTCHEVTGPGLFHETTLDEYAAYAPDGSAAATGGGCAGCHMPPTDPGPIALGQTNTRPRADHSFVGVDPPWGASAEVAASAAAATLQLLQSALGLAATRSGDGFDVTLTNRAGHAVPTGITFVRGFWVDVELTGADGTSAALPSVVTLGSQPTEDGAPVALITQADAVVPHSIGPGATLTFHVDVPPSVTPPVTARMTLRAAAIRPEVLDALGLERVAAEVPTHEIASVVVP
jgi:hypothetical protein